MEVLELTNGEYEIVENYVSSNIRARPKPIRFKKDRQNCWICTSHAKAKHRGGYPVIRRFDKHTRMSRYVLFLKTGEVKEDCVAMHLCDNPGCINPEHLKFGTSKENSQDMSRKRRNKTGEDTCMAKLKNDDVIYIFESTESCLKLADRFNVSKKTILNIRHVRTWRNLLIDTYGEDLITKRRR